MLKSDFLLIKVWLTESNILDKKLISFLTKHNNLDKHHIVLPINIPFSFSTFFIKLNRKFNKFSVSFCDKI